MTFKKISEWSDDKLKNVKTEILKEQNRREVNSNLIFEISIPEHIAKMFKDVDKNKEIYLHIKKIISEHIHDEFDGFGIRSPHVGIAYSKKDIKIVSFQAKKFSSCSDQTAILTRQEISNYLLSL